VYTVNKSGTFSPVLVLAGTAKGIDSDRLGAIFGPAARHRERWRLKRWRVLSNVGSNLN
jgi:hypothetical protein